MGNQAANAPRKFSGTPPVIAGRLRENPEYP
jgi:hypothetical protein